AGGGWILGHTIDGVQAEYARIPFADTSMYLLPDGVRSADAVMLADILPTGYEVGVLNGGVGPGDTVVIVGAGPIGLAAIMTAKLYSPSAILVVDPAASDPLEVVRAVTGGLGADAALEAVGIPATFELCTELVRPGGRVANVGVHGHPATLHLEKLWIKDITITTGLVDAVTTPMLLRLIEGGRLDPTPFATHRFELADTEAAYDVFADAAETQALKVVLTATPVTPETPAAAEAVGAA